MKYLKKLAVTVLLFTFIVAVSDIPAISNPVVAHAAAIKISKKALSLDVDETAALKVTGTKKSVKWTSSDDAVVTVSAKGATSTIKGIADGKAVITASVAGKKLKCKVNVTNPLVKDAPFDAQEVAIEGIHLIIPSDWTTPSSSNMTGELSSEFAVLLKPNDANKKAEMDLSITHLADEDVQSYSDYDTFKKMESDTDSQDAIKASITETLGTDIPITSYEQTDIVTSFGKALKTDVELSIQGVTLKLVKYDFIADNYLVSLIAMDAGALSGGIDAEKIGDYLVKTITIK